MDLGLGGQSAVITGASKGIGAAAAHRLAQEGCNLHLCARTESDLEVLAADIRQRYGNSIQVTVYALDLAQTADQDTLAGSCLDADILVNNAGNIPSGELDTFTDASWRAGWDLKVFGYINLCRQFYTAMKSRGRGVIVNVIGAAGVRPDASYIAGTTGNAALNAFTRALGSRSVDFGIRVVGINPSMTDTPRGQRILQFKKEHNPDDPGFVQHFLAGLPFGRMASADEIAVMIAFLASKHSAYTSGTVVDIDGGTSARP